MPQLSKGGKFVFGKSLIQADWSIRFPPQAVEEYGIALEGKVYLFSGSKTTGGFCVTRRGLLLPSKIGCILADRPALRDYLLPQGKFVRYKGRIYCWLTISPDGVIRLTERMMEDLSLQAGMELLSIRSSDIAFVMGAKGPLLEHAANYEGVIEVY